MSAFCKNCRCVIADPIQKIAGFCTAFCMVQYDAEKDLFLRRETERLNEIDGTWEAAQ